MLPRMLPFLNNKNNPKFLVKILVSQFILAHLITSIIVKNDSVAF